LEAINATVELRVSEHTKAVVPAHRPLVLADLSLTPDTGT
jgi:hypothetical protein